MTTRVKFTDTTWADLATTGLTHDRSRGVGLAGEYVRPLHWTDQHDLALELVERQPVLTFEDARELISAVSSRLPLILTWKQWMEGLQSWEVVTTTVLPDQLFPPAEDEKRRDGVPGSVRVHYWGFGHSIYLNQILAVEVPKQDVTFTSEEPQR